MSDLDDFNADIIFTNEEKKGNSAFETVLIFNQNYTILLRYYRNELVCRCFLCLKCQSVHASVSIVF